MIFFYFLLFAVAGAFGQTAIPNPVHFDYSIASHEPGAAEIRIKATLERGWHIYAQHQPKAAIAVPTSITFTKSPLWRSTGAVTEQGRVTRQSLPEVGIEQLYYADSVTFVEPIKIRGKSRQTITGTIIYQVCTEEMCLPPKTVPFSITLPL